MSDSEAKMDSVDSEVTNEFTQAAESLEATKVNDVEQHVESDDGDDGEKDTEKHSKKGSPPKNLEGHDTEKSERLTRLPIARIRTLVKADQDIALATQESIFLITKCTELFIEYLAKETHKKTLASKRKTMQKADLDSVIDVMDEFSFLEGILDT